VVEDHLGSAEQVEDAIAGRELDARLTFLARNLVPRLLLPQLDPYGGQTRGGDK
jgi:hypothetical protein